MLLYVSIYVALCLYLCVFVLVVLLFVTMQFVLCVIKNKKINYRCFVQFLFILYMFVCDWFVLTLNGLGFSFVILISY
jgi:hypothetical protein